MRKAYQFLEKKILIKFLLLILGVLFAILFVKEFNTPEIKAKQKTQNKSTQIKKLIDKADLFFEKK